MVFPLPPTRWRRTLKPLSTHLLHPLRRLLLLLFNMAAPAPEQESAPQPPPFDPSKPSVPISYPIKDLETLESRSYFDSFHCPFNRATVPLPPSAAGPLPDHRRLLVCHDMKGGYVDDKWVQGGANADAYSIWHWYLMDVFVYFSHSLVTLPPPCWTNAAHTHGVKVLGTFITEWDEGKATCKALLSTKESAQMYAERLAELAVHLGFDGWLLNMEVSLSLEQIAVLKEFVNHLTQTMHSILPGSLVIWYDSVTKYGDLRWQDQLNDMNKPFFDLCDGIFTNYTWKENYPKLSADAAGDRRFDVYMGIDVFGRNSYGGGQWNTNIALDLLKKDDVSAALFAPGWVYETNQSPDFQTAQNRWWGLVEQSWGILQSYPKVLPFYTNFDQGHGYHFSIKGLPVVDGPWNNISCQNFQPMLDSSSEPNQSNLQVFFNFKDASYCGGGNITCKGTLRADDPFSTGIFQGQLPFYDLPVHIAYSVRSKENSVMGLSLGFSSKTNERHSTLIANDVQSSLMDRLIAEYDEIISPQAKTANEDDSVAEPWALYGATITKSGYTLTDINIFCYVTNSGPSNKLGNEVSSSENGVVVIGDFSSFSASLGHISLQTSMQNNEFLKADSWITEGHYVLWDSLPNGSRTVSLKISWKFKLDSPVSYMKYNIFVENLAEHVGTSLAVSPKYLGVARVEGFYVSQLEVPIDAVGLRFIIQACRSDGVCQEVEESPTFLLAVQSQ